MKISNLYLLTAISILFFLVKGIQYALIGSYIPLSVVLIAIGGLYWSFSKKSKTYQWFFKVWGVLVIIWAVTRLAVWLMFEIDKSLSETHIREQFGILQHLITIVMMVIGITIFRTKKNKPTNYGKQL